MVFVFGTRLYGKCDEVPGLFHVATKFGHFDYIPLIPSGTVLIFSKTGNRYTGLAIPMSLKSVMVTWIRAAAFLGIALGIIGLIILFADSRKSSDVAIPMTGIGIVSVALMIGSYYIPFFRRPSWERACQLGTLAQLTDTGWQRLGAAYGRVVPSGGISRGSPVSQAIPMEQSDS